MVAGKNTAQENGSEQDARKRRILKLFPMLDATPGERASALSKMLRMIEEGGFKFYDLFSFKEEVGGSNDPEKATDEDIEQLEKVVSELLCDVANSKKESRQKIADIDSLSRENGRLKQLKDKIEDEVYEYKCEVFRISGLPKPTHPRDGISFQEPPLKPKKRSKPEEFPNNPFVIHRHGPDLGDKHPEWKLLVNKIDQRGSYAKVAIEELGALLKKEGLRFIDILEPRDGTLLLPEEERERLKKAERVYDSIDAACRQSAQLEDEMGDKDDIILQFKFNNVRIQKKMKSLKTQLAIYKLDLQEKKSHQTTAKPGTLFNQPQPTPQPTPAPQPSASTVTQTRWAQPFPPLSSYATVSTVHVKPPSPPQPRTTRIVSPPPKQPAKSTPRATTTPPTTQSHQPNLASKKKSIWMWPRRYPVSAVSLFCALVLGSGYTITAQTGFDVFAPADWSSLFSSAAKKISVPSPDTLTSRGTGPVSQPPGTGVIHTSPQIQETYYKTFYVAYDPVVLWKDVKNGDGYQKIDTLHFGDQVEVELPAGQGALLEQNEWIQVKDPKSQAGYVMGKQLSVTKPSVRPNIEMAVEKAEFKTPPVQPTPKKGQKYDITLPIKTEIMEVFICNGQSFVSDYNGAPITIDSNIRISSYSNHYTSHTGNKGHLTLRHYSQEGNSNYYAKIHIQGKPDYDYMVPYTSISLVRGSCRQALFLNTHGNYE